MEFDVWIDVDAILGEARLLLDQDCQKLPEQLVHGVDAVLTEVLPVDGMTHEEEDSLDAPGVRSIVHLSTTLGGVRDGDTRLHRKSL